jgi:transcriptional regulator GlxA family with amidase domain
MDAETGDSTQEIGFILVPGFALMSFASGCEAFRAANDLAGRPRHRLRYFGEPTGWEWPEIHATLRRITRLGVRIGGISGGPYPMAAAGLLADRAFTLHWEYAGATVETFPEARLSRARYVADGDRLTCGGGAPLEMAAALIGERMGEAFARRVFDWFLRTAIGAADDPQRASAVERYGVHHPPELETMEKTVEAPPGRIAMARRASISPRHLDRLFLEKLGLSFSAQYRAIRLAHGRRLLRRSPLRIGEIATACGFSSAGHFSRSYRSQFGCSPSAER